ncbi:hypothetical protein B0T24DRAFT_538371 [Lasiosphaeria ovina]|uniref:DUF7587 domain-containing protein n=1 Tax=Lasiosphaeria ovina TaxID=92902 RepID=A0AAE0MZA2_9PEZI|nr:hypothetical protein B0T24DRAFT_538371 [Lasiosphaeria ovina]
MAEAYDGLVHSIAGLSLTSDTAKLSGSTSSHPSPRQTFVNAARALTQAAEATAAQAKRVPLTESPNPHGGEDVAQLISLRRKANTLTNIAATFGDATDCYVVAHISALAGQETSTQKILSHFHVDLMRIAQEVLNSATDDSRVLPEILERCYKESLNYSGALHYENYSIPLREASLGWPYDPDFESEKYYDHEERLGYDEYVKAFSAQYERKLDNERKQEENWIGFWVRALSSFPNGPTLFYPPTSRFPELRLADVPRYLFRTFDPASSGRNDDYVFASLGSISAKSWRSKVDFLSRGEEEAAGMLHGHLTKSCFGAGIDGDNLVSWSSSLIFVIQYAIWRCYHRRCANSEVKICAVDTTKFPQGQFVRDMTLIRAYRQTSNLENEIRRFFHFRLDNPCYDNGEYLSQGELHHRGRSCVFSLDQLTEAGLHGLYPEFAENTAKNKWTNRVRDLRSGWSNEHTTTQLDIERALGVARACFSIFIATDVALLLLSFKNRKLRPTTATGPSQPSDDTQERRRSLTDYGPKEVQRYMKIAETRMPKSRDSFNTKLLEGVFECS